MQHENSSNSSQEAGDALNNDSVLPPEDQWPAPGEVWLHRKGEEYTVIAVTSKPDPEKAEKFPVTVFYRGPDGRKWPRKLTSWMKSFTRLRPAPAEVDVAAIAQHRSIKSAGQALAASLEANLTGSQEVASGRPR